MLRLSDLPPLDSLPWGEIPLHYDKPGGLPRAFDRFRDGDTGAAGLGLVWSLIWHQGSPSDGLAAIAPYLLALANDTDTAREIRVAAMAMLAGPDDNRSPFPRGDAMLDPYRAAMAPYHKDVVELACRDPFGPLRSCALITLARIDATDPAIIQRLDEQLGKERARQTRVDLVLTFAALAGRDGVPRLRELASDSEPLVARAAGYGCLAVDPLAATDDDVRAVISWKATERDGNATGTTWMLWPASILGSALRDNPALTRALIAVIDESAAADSDDVDDLLRMAIALAFPRRTMEPRVHVPELAPGHHSFRPRRLSPLQLEVLDLIDRHGDRGGGELDDYRIPPDREVRETFAEQCRELAGQPARPVERDLVESLHPHRGAASHVPPGWALSTPDLDGLERLVRRLGRPQQVLIALTATEMAVASRPPDWSPEVLELARPVLESVAETMVSGTEPPRGDRPIVPEEFQLPWHPQAPLTLQQQADRHVARAAVFLQGLWHADDLDPWLHPASYVVIAAGEADTWHRATAPANSEDLQDAYEEFLYRWWDRCVSRLAFRDATQAEIERGG